MTLGEELLQDQIDRLDEDKRDLTKMLALAIQALKKIASPTQTNALLWWQIEAREALAKVGAGGTAPDGHNGAIQGPRSGPAGMEGSIT